tara:strand:+ start:424 stop:612 length:189 start_codon:yes stop_codon:yes gene_type:complete
MRIGCTMKEITQNKPIAQNVNNRTDEEGLLPSETLRVCESKIKLEVTNVTDRQEQGRSLNGL